jgi:hypothetical protein
VRIKRPRHPERVELPRSKDRVRCGRPGPGHGLDRRYIDVGATLRALGHAYRASNEPDVRNLVDQSAEELARYDLNIWQEVGPAVQLALVDVIEGLACEEWNLLRPLLPITS